MDDDFNTPQALAVLFDFARAINRRRDEHFSIAKKQELLVKLSEVMGLTIGRAEKPVLDPELQNNLWQSLTSISERVLAAGMRSPMSGAQPSADAESLLEILLSAREDLRKARQFQLADEIRTTLAGLGIALEDTPSGTAWKYKRQT
jgi:cysteinyl-tRNA synthetase